MKHLTDAELMNRVKAKETAALEELYDRYVKLVYSFAYKITGDEQQTRQIVQAVFVRLWTTQSGYDPNKGKFVNWLLTITRRMAIDLYRSENKGRQTIGLSESEWDLLPGRPDDEPDHAVSRILTRDRIREAHRHLTQAQAELLRHLYWEGYSLREIAAMRNEPIGTVKSRLYQTLKVLRRHLAWEMEE